jgi:molecular chaperone GrpE (heat shock protein)
MHNKIHDSPISPGPLPGRGGPDWFYRMINFEAELDKLLSLENGKLPQYEFAEFAAAGRELLADLNRKQTGTSLQIEEIYDMVKEQDSLREKADAEKLRADQLVLAAVGLSDLLEDFCAYARRSGSEALRGQARLLWEKAGGILSGCGILRFGAEGQTLNPQLHTVKAGAESPFPREQVAELLQSGYAYRNSVIRKAAVVVSRGQNDGKTEMPEIENQDHNEGEGADGQNSRY